MHKDLQVKIVSHVGLFLRYKSCILTLSKSVSFITNPNLLHINYM